MTPKLCPLTVVSSSRLSKRLGFFTEQHSLGSQAVYNAAKAPSLTAAVNKAEAHDLLQQPLKEYRIITPILLGEAVQVSSDSREGNRDPPFDGVNNK